MENKCIERAYYGLNKHVRKIHHAFVLAYLDDILINHSKPAEHLAHLKLVLDELQEYKFVCNAHKRRFTRLSLSYVRHMVTCCTEFSVNKAKTSATGSCPFELMFQHTPMPSPQHMLKNFLNPLHVAKRAGNSISRLDVWEERLDKTGGAVSETLVVHCMNQKIVWNSRRQKRTGALKSRTRELCATFHQVPKLEETSSGKGCSVFTVFHSIFRAVKFF